MNRFLVTGLPRSRTAWMSAFLSTDESICIHEPTAHMQCFDDIDRFYKSWPHRYVGASDSTLALWVDKLLIKQKPKTLIIYRDLEDVENSLEKLGTGLPKTNFCELLLEKLILVKSNPLVMWVDFESLNEQRVIERIWWHLMPAVPFDEERYRRMNNLNITANVNDIPLRVSGIMNDVIPLVKIV